jgi:A/G-specific adenine glycosylase
MAALPGSDWSETQGPPPARVGTVRHVFTHFSLDLAIVPGSEALGQGWWHSLASLAEAGLPTLYRRAAELALGARERARAAA